jgi:hypothetical protein
MVAALGLYLFANLDPKTTAWELMLPLAVMAFGLGFGMAQRTNIVASVVDQHEIGVASSILALVRNVAGAFGIAIFGTILTNAVTSNVLNINRWSVLRSTNPVDIQKFIALIELKAQIDAYNEVFLVAATIVFLGAFVTLWLKVKERTDITVHVE